MGQIVPKRRYQTALSCVITQKTEDYYRPVTPTMLRVVCMSCFVLFQLLTFFTEMSRNFRIILCVSGAVHGLPGQTAGGAASSLSERLSGRTHGDRKFTLTTAVADFIQKLSNGFCTELTGWLICTLLEKVFVLHGSRWLSRYTDLLRAWRFGDHIPVGAEFSAPVQTDPGAHPSYKIDTASLSRE